MITNDSHAGFGSGRKKLPEPKDLFIPLKREYFEAFERGDKNTEYRLPGGRWNERTCYPGRSVVLSLGYGKQRRLKGRVVNFEVRPLQGLAYAAFVTCYPGKPNLAACIQISRYQEPPQRSTLEEF